MSGSNDARIKVWRASTGECLLTLAGHDLLVRALSFDPRTLRLVSASYDRSIKVWDLSDLAASSAPSGARPRPNANAGSDSGSGLGGNGNGNGSGKAPVGRMVRDFRGAHGSHIFDVRFDACRIVSTSHDQKIGVLDFAAELDADIFL